MTHTVTSSSLLSSFSTSSTSSTSISSTKKADAGKNSKLYQKLIGIEGLETEVASFACAETYLTKKIIEDKSYKKALRETYAETLRIFKKNIGISAFFSIAERAIFDLKKVVPNAPANISNNKSLLAKRIFRNLFKKIKLMYGDGFLKSLFPNEDITSVSKVMDYSIYPDILEKMHRWIEDINLIKMMNIVARQNNQASQSLEAQSLLGIDIDCSSLEVVHTRAQSFRAWIRGNNNILLNITELNLEKLGFTSLPPEIDKFINLQTLYLTNNYLTQLPDSIGNLENLRLLCLPYNYLTQLPASIGNLGDLQNLFIRNNSLTRLPETIGNLGNLLILDLEKNPLLTQLPNSFGNLRNLQSLALDDNSLTQPPDMTNLAQDIKKRIERSLKGNKDLLPEPVFKFYVS